MPNCPFCGMATEIPHETQQACIEALNAEITRTRELIDNVRQAELLPAPQIGQDSDKDPV
jgi:hypothetical protein